MKKPSNAVILAAGKLTPSLAAIFGKASSAMLPVNGRPTIHWSLRYLSEQGIKHVVLGVREDDMRLRRFVNHAFGSILDITFVPISEDRGPGFTLLSCLRRLSENESCMIVLWDTLFSFPDTLIPDSFSHNFVLVAPVEDAARWCLAQVEDNGRVSRLVDKPPENPEKLPALIGVYFLEEIENARKALEELEQTGSDNMQLRHALQPQFFDE